MPLSYEARAWKYYYTGEWARSLKECYGWFHDEPFSSRPAVLGSFISSAALESYTASEDFAHSGLRSNPDDQILRNNLVFALASAGKIDEAEEKYNQMQPALFDTHAKITWIATGGLLEFRKGNVDHGRQKYRQAIELATGDRYVTSRALATAFWAREEFRAMNPAADEILNLAAKAAKRAPDPVADLIIRAIDERYARRR